jgi:IclR family pca regulon transcriptional regulator
LRLSDGYLTGSTLATIAQSYAEIGRDQLGEAVSVAIYDHGSALFIARAPVERIVSLGVRMGAKLSAYASATGRVLLSGKSATERAAYLKSVQPTASTPNTLTDPEDIEARIQAVSVDGYALTDEELEMGIRTLAVPVKDHTGTIHAAMSSSSFAGRISVDEMLDQHLPILRKQAAELGQRL